MIRHFQERMPYVPDRAGGGMPAPLSRDGARHWAVLPTRSLGLGGDGGSVRIALSSSSVIAVH
jgi:hypothetical protein